MQRPSSRTMKKYSLYLLATLILGVVLSLVSTAFFSNKVVHQLKDLKIDQPSLRNQQVKELSTSLHFLNITVSNPFFALFTLAATTPQTFAPTSRAINGADHFLAAVSDYLQGQESKEIQLADAATQLASAMPELNKSILALSQLHVRGLFSPLDKKLNQPREKAADLYQTTSAITPILQIFPGISGQDSARKYLIAFQNSAEARGTGGILGAYAVMKIDKGKTSFTAFGSNAGLIQLKDTPIAMPAEFVRLYNDDPGIWQNSNISPHFPYGATIWLALWKNQFKQELDGVITFDPTALSYLLKATGPVQVEGQAVNADNVVKTTLSDVYQKYETDNNARKAFLIKIIQAVSKKIEGKEFSATDLLSQMIYPINQHRILFYSVNKAEQKIIEQSSISGSVSKKIDNQYRLIIQNTSGNKMDYYLKRTLKLESLSCGVKGQTKVTFSITNTASRTSKLPAYVAGRLDLNKPQGLANSYGTRAILMAPVGAHLINATDLATKKKFGFLIKERGHKGVGVQVDLAAGQTRSFSLTFSGGKGALTSYVQPLVIDQKNTIIDTCKP